MNRFNLGANSISVCNVAASFAASPMNIVFQKKKKNVIKCPSYKRKNAFITCPIEG